MNDRLYNLGSLESAAKSEYKHCQEQSHTDNTKVEHVTLLLLLCVEFGLEFTENCLSV